MGLAFAIALGSGRAHAADTSLIADIRSARSLVAEAAEIQELSRKGALTGPYVRIASGQMRDQLDALAKHDRDRSPELAQDIDQAVRALDAGNADQLRALAAALTELDAHATAD